VAAVDPADLQDTVGVELRRKSRAENGGDVPEPAPFRPAAELTPEAAAVAEQVRVRVRVLRWFGRSGLIEPGDVCAMLAWQNTGFSLDTAGAATRCPVC
jgi:hypothetical protein